MFRLKCEHSLIVLVETLKDCNPKFYILLNQKLRMAVFILETRYPSGRASANILKIVLLSVSSIKTGTRRITRLDELLFETRLERRISKSRSSRRVTRLLPVFILETDNRTIFKMFAEAHPDG